MKRILAAALSALSLATLGIATARASDLPRATPYAKAPAYVSPLYDWSGFYAGIFGGGGWGRHNYLDATSSTNYSASGGLIGATAGANWQFGNVVVGAEGDIAWANIAGTGAPPTVTSNRSELQWVGTVRGRAGYAVDNILLYGTAGWAYGGLRNTNTNGALVDQFTTSKSGWTAGGGAEFAFTPNVTGRVEYRYYDLGRVGLAAPPNGAAPYTASNSYQTVTVGLNYKWGGPAVRKY